MESLFERVVVAYDYRAPLQMLYNKHNVDYRAIIIEDDWKECQELIVFWEFLIVLQISVLAFRDPSHVYSP